MQSLQALDSFLFRVLWLASHESDACVRKMIRHAYLLLGLLLATTKAINLMRVVELKHCDA